MIFEADEEGVALNVTRKITSFDGQVLGLESGWLIVFRARLNSPSNNFEGGGIKRMNFLFSSIRHV